MFSTAVLPHSNLASEQTNVTSMVIMESNVTSVTVSIFKDVLATLGPIGNLTTVTSQSTTWSTSSLRMMMSSLN